MFKFVQIRKEKGISQTELSHLARIPRPKLNEIERNKRVAYPAWRKRIAQALGVEESEAFQSMEL